MTKLASNPDGTPPSTALVLYNPGKPAPTYLARALKLARTALMVWGGVSLAAATGLAIGAVASDPAEVAADPGALVTHPAASSAAARPMVARAAMPPPVTGRPSSTPPAAAVAPIAATPTAAAELAVPEPIVSPPAEAPAVAVSVPRAKPDEPRITGSVNKQSARHSLRRRSPLRYAMPRHRNPYVYRFRDHQGRPTVYVFGR